MPCEPEVCATITPGRNAPDSPRCGDERRERVVGHGEDHQIGVADDVFGAPVRGAGKQVGDAGGRGVGSAAGAGDRVAGAASAAPMAVPTRPAPTMPMVRELTLVLG